MTLVSPSQSNPNDEITAEAINGPINQIASVINGNIDSTNVASLSGARLNAGTVPASALDTNANPETRLSESLGDFVASGLIWSSTTGLGGAMSSGVVYIGGKRIAVSAVSAKTFTASKDTYVSVDNNGSVGYSEVANNAAGPSLPANSIWIAVVVTGASTVSSCDDASVRSPGSGELVRRTLGSASSSIRVPVFAARSNLKVRVMAIDTGGTISVVLQFNNDTSTNYAVRVSTTGAADVAVTGESGITVSPSVAAYPHFGEYDIINFATSEKLLVGDTVSRGTSGSGNAPVRREATGKWANTSAQITSIVITNTGTGSFASGSQIIVRGWN